MADLKDRQVIEDGFINKMLTNPQYLAAFPFLKQYAAAAKAQQAGCGRCGRKAQSRAVDYTAVKQTLAAMPPDGHAKLLQLTRSRSVLLVYRNRVGKVVKLVISARA